MKKTGRKDFGLDRMTFMLRFLKGSGVSYAVGLAALASYPLLSDVFSGQLYRVVTDWGDGAARFAPGMARVSLLMLLILLVEAGGSILFQRATASGDRAVRAELARSLLHMPMSQWCRRHSGDWLTVLGKDADNATDVYKEQLQRLAGSAVSIVGGLILLCAASLPMAAASVAIGLVYLGVGATRAKAMKRTSAKVRGAAAKVTEQFSNLLAGAWSARFYSVGRFLMGRHAGAVEETYRSERSVVGVQMALGALAAMGYTLCYSGALIIGLVLVYAGRMELPVMLSLWPISMGVSFGLTDLGFFAADFQPAVTAVDRVKGILDLPREQGGALEHPPAAQPALEARDVSFTYEGGARPALSHVNLCVREGERVAFVGGSGSGKTTLMKLFLRLYDPGEGEMRVFGAEAGTYSLPCLRGQFAYVPQSARLLAGSIEDNLRLVREDATDAQVRESCRRAGVDRFLSQLPQGLKSDAGESGARLSGGQRQRIAIARAFLRDAPVLVFDEVTASLDGESEEAITEALRRMDRSKTLLLITHRLSTALLADRIVVLDGGRVAEEGTHEELLALNGTYARLWNAR